MAEDPINDLRLSLMQDFLPVGLAMFERAKKGGASKVVEAFTLSDNPLQELKEEGELSAQTFREKLDQVSPGLGNPVVSVDVSVEDADWHAEGNLENEDSLNHVLGQIETRLDRLEKYFNFEADQEGFSSNKNL